MCSESIQCEHALDPASLRTYSSVLAIKTKLYVCIFLAAAFVLNHAEHDPTLQSVGAYVCKRHWQSVVRETCQWCTITEETTLLALLELVSDLSSYGQHRSAWNCSNQSSQLLYTKSLSDKFGRCT